MEERDGGHDRGRSETAEKTCDNIPMAEIVRLDEVEEEAALARCLEALEAGALVVLPTDTVYGLAARADLEEAVAAAFAVKGRNTAKSLVVMVGSAEVAERLASPEDRASLRRLFSLWPGPLTVVVKAAGIPWKRFLAPGTETLGVRVPDHPFMLRLLSASGPLAVTSANLSGKSAPRSFDEIDPLLLDRVELALDAGRCGSGVPSTVVKLEGSNFRLLRQGEVGEERIAALMAGEGSARQDAVDGAEERAKKGQ